MDKVIVKDIRTGATKEVKKALAGDYIATGNFVLVEKEDKYELPKRKEEK